MSEGGEGEEAAPAPPGIRSRIAAFENISGPTTGTTTAAAAEAATTATASKGASSKTSQCNSITSSAPQGRAVPTIIRPANAVRTPVPVGDGHDPLSTSSQAEGASGRSRSPTRGGSTASTSRVLLPGLGQQKGTPSSVVSHALAPPPPPSSQAPTTKPGLATHPSDHDSDALQTSPTSVKSLQQHFTMSPSPLHSPTPSPSPARSPAADDNKERLDLTTPRPNLTPAKLPPVVPPQLPSRSSTIASTASNQSDRSSSPASSYAGNSRPLGVTSMAAPSKEVGSSSSSNNNHDNSSSPKSKPVLPPRKAGPSSSSPSSSLVPPERTGAFQNPPVRKSTLSNVASTAQPSASALSRPALEPPSRSNSLPGLPPRPRSGTAASTLSNKSSGSQISSTRSMPPVPPPLSSPSQGSLKTQQTPIRSRAGQMSLNGRPIQHPGNVERYDKLWSRLVEAVEGERGAQREKDPRLDGLVVREVWRMSKLSSPTLSRIWNQCDPARQGSLDKDGFCKGLHLVDEELRRRRRAGKT